LERRLSPQSARFRNLDAIALVAGTGHHPTMADIIYCSFSFLIDLP